MLRSASLTCKSLPQYSDCATKQNRHIPVGQATHGGPGMRGLGRYVPGGHTSSSQRKYFESVALQQCRNGKVEPSPSVTKTHTIPEHHARRRQTYGASLKPVDAPQPPSQSKYAAFTTPTPALHNSTTTTTTIVTTSPQLLSRATAD